MKKILICGIPRSGTTWISKVLSYNSNVQYIHEPDNERQNLFGITFKNDLDRFPYLTKGEDCPNYKKLFEKAYTGYFLEPYGRPSKIIRKIFSLDINELEQRVSLNKPYPAFRIDLLSYLREKLLNGTIHLTANMSKIQNSLSSGYDAKLMKSVHCILAVDFLNEKLKLDHILIIFRHPASIIASHLRMDNKDIWRPILQKSQLWNGPLQPFKNKVMQLEDPLAKAGAKIGAVYYLFEQYLTMENCHAVCYESVCREKITEFKKFYGILDLNWTQDVKDYIYQLNKKGEGYDVNRISEIQVNKWKQELSELQISSIKAGYRIFPLDLEYSFSLDV